MKRIAYIITTDQDCQQLDGLITSLNHKTDFYVHKDVKSNIIPFQEKIKDKVPFVPRLEIS